MFTRAKNSSRFHPGSPRWALNVLEELERRMLLSETPCGCGGLFAGGIASHLITPPVAEVATASASVSPSIRPAAAAPTHVGDSPFDPPVIDDNTFVVDQSPGLDTGCVFQSHGPLIFDIPITRYLGNIAKLESHGLIKSDVTLEMPVFDVDYAGIPSDPSTPPERDRISLNGHVLNPEFLTGENNVWKLNTFTVPLAWLNLPRDPGVGGTLVPALNTIQIDIDTLNSSDVWCTQVDWAALTIPAPSPVLLVHGILSSSKTWATTWVPGLADVGILADTIDMGVLNSISNDSSQIATKVDELQQRWGVQKLNIVAHSKGGLDSRDFITERDSKDSIGTLIQIGTPNGGSPLADVEQFASAAALDAGLGLIGGTIAQALLNYTLAPAFKDLTPEFMNAYNESHGYNPDTQYISLAGDYDPAGNDLLASITALPFQGAPNDSVVGESSVYALPYAQDLVYSSSAGSTPPDKSAKHFASPFDGNAQTETSSTGIFNLLLPYLETPAPSASQSAFVQRSQSAVAVAPQTARAAKRRHSSPPPPQRTAAIASTVGRHAVNSHSIVIDSAGPAYFTVQYNTGNLDLSLVSPSGKVIDHNSPASDSQVHFASDETRDGYKSEVYLLDNPEAGTWTVKVRGTTISDPTGLEAYVVSAAMTNSAMQLTASLDQAGYRTGQPMRITGSLLNGSTPVGATVTAQVLRPDQTVATVTLADDGKNGDAQAGDGIYTGTVSDTSQAGAYQISLLASGSRRHPFTREASLLTAVATGNSQLTGTFSDNPVDTDGDGLANTLAVNVGLNIASAAHYHLVGDLATHSGQTLGTATFEGDLTPGVQTATLNFQGATLFKSGVTGPYVLRSLSLTQDAAEATVQVDQRANAYTTAAYTAQSFQHPAILITGLRSDHGVDTNRDHRFEQLDVNLNVNLLTAGDYNWTGRLVDSRGNEVGFAANQGTLPAGATSITLSFDGAIIARSGGTGRFYVRDLLMYSSSTSTLTSGPFRTNAYTLKQFPDVTAPVPSATPVRITSNETTTTLNVTYSDETGVSSSSLDDNDIVVTGGRRGSIRLPAVFVSSRAVRGTPNRVATYTIAGPGGSWDSADKGSYHVYLNPSQVSDTVGNVNTSSILVTDITVAIPARRSHTTPAVSATPGSVFAIARPILASATRRTITTDALGDVLLGKSPLQCLQDSEPRGLPVPTWQGVESDVAPPGGTDSHSNTSRNVPFG